MTAKRVGDVLARRGRRPGVVAAVAELDVEVGAGERGPARIERRARRAAGRVDLLLHQDLRREVGDLRAEHRDRRAALGLGARDEQRVRGARDARRRLSSSAADRRAARRRRAPRRPAAGRSSRRPRSGSTTLPGSGSAATLGASGTRMYGKRVPSCTVVGASGSLARRKSFHTRGPGALSEALLGRLQHERGVDLVAAALAEDPGDQRGDRDHVGDLPVLGALRVAEQRVLARHAGAGWCGSRRSGG